MRLEIEILFPEIRFINSTWLIWREKQIIATSFFDFIVWSFGIEYIMRRKNMKNRVILFWNRSLWKTGVLQSEGRA